MSHVRHTLKRANVPITAVNKTEIETETETEPNRTETNRTETKRNEPIRHETTRNETTRNGTERNETKRNDTKRRMWKTSCRARPDSMRVLRWWLQIHLRPVRGRERLRFRCGARLVALAGPFLYAALAWFLARLLLHHGREKIRKQHKHAHARPRPPAPILLRRACPLHMCGFDVRASCRCSPEAMTRCAAKVSDFVFLPPPRKKRNRPLVRPVAIDTLCRFLKGVWRHGHTQLTFHRCDVRAPAPGRRPRTARVGATTPNGCDNVFAPFFWLLCKRFLACLTSTCRRSPSSLTGRRATARPTTLPSCVLPDCLPPPSERAN